MNRDRVLDDIAGAILDGTPVDWTRCDSPDSPIDQALVEQLRTLSALQRMPRTGSSTLPQEPWNWGHLQVFERIGHGAFGDVHRAWDTRLEREVALKLLHSTARSSEGSDAIEEGRLLARVRHPNVVTIYGAERTGGRVGLWMELITGRTLEQAMRDGRKFTTAEVIRLGMDLSRAISAVHKAGLLHRDIKAQNIMLDESGRLVLMDFGTGRELGVPPDSQTAGTPLYLAPEVLSGGEARPPSDVYSIGVVLFRLATGSYPVFGANLSDLRRVHATAGGAVALERPEIPVRLRRVLARALDPNPDRRYADADELGAALGGLQRTPLLRRVMYAAAGVAALVGVIASGWTFVVRRTLTPAPSPATTTSLTDSRAKSSTISQASMAWKRDRRRLHFSSKRDLAMCMTFPSSWASTTSSRPLSTVLAIGFESTRSSCEFPMTCLSGPNRSIARSTMCSQFRMRFHAQS